MIESTSPQLPTDMPLPTGSDAGPYGRRRQLLQELLNHSELLLKNQLEVRHLMTVDPIVIAPTMGFDDIRAVLERQRLHHVLVGGMGNEILGYVFDQDLTVRRAPTAQHLMRSPVLTVAPNTPLNPAITYLINENTSCLAVYDGPRLCGMLTTNDLILTLQCTLQLWMRLAQVLHQDLAWPKDLDKIVAALNRDLTAAQLADQIAKSRVAIQQRVDQLANAVDLRMDVFADMPNRQGLEEVLDMLLAVKRRFGHSFSLAVVAIDHFHAIRESCGEAVTGRLVKAVVRLIERAARDSDYIARSRVDTFAVVMPHTSLDDAETFCAQLRAAARKNRELNMELRVSVGAVAPASNEDSSQLLERAEAAIASS